MRIIILGIIYLNIRRRLKLYSQESVIPSNEYVSMFIPSDHKTCTEYLVDRYSHATAIMIKTQDFHKSVKLHGVNIRLTKNLQILKQEQY